MRVQCHKIVSTVGPTLGEAIDAKSGGGVTVGKDYLVLGMELHSEPPGGRLATWLQVIDDCNEPTWVPAAMFVTISGALASSWEATIGKDGVILIGPQPWLEHGFWATFHSDSMRRAEIERAHEIYRHEVALIREEDDSGAQK